MTVRLESRPVVESPERRARRTNGALLGIIVILSAALIGAGAWALAGPRAATADLPAGAQEALDGYREAWAGFDGGTAMSFATPGYAFVTSGNALDAAMMADRIHYATVAGRVTTEPEQEMVSGGGSTYHVVQTELGDGLPAGVSVITLVEIDGTWKVSRHEWLPIG